jgi:hypothetical protein
MDAGAGMTNALRTPGASRRQADSERLDRHAGESRHPFSTAAVQFGQWPQSFRQLAGNRREKAMPPTDSIGHEGTALGMAQDHSE